MRDDFRYWLPFLAKDCPAELTSPAQVAQYELEHALPVVAPDMTVSLVADNTSGESFAICKDSSTVTITGSDVGLLYGTYRLLMALYANEEIPCNHSQQPKYALRMLNCWDNADGDIERGYSGRSLFFDDGLVFL